MNETGKAREELKNPNRAYRKNVPTNKKRQPGESIQEYRARQKILKRYYKMKQRGKVSWPASCGTYEK